LCKLSRIPFLCESDLRRFGGKSGDELEQEVYECLCEKGFERLSKKSSQPFPQKHFAYQPNGSQEKPDFLVYYNGKEYVLEVKGAKRNNPVLYNSRTANPLNEREYYLIAKESKVCCIPSQDIISTQDFQTLDEYFQEYRSLVKKYNNKLKKQGSTYTITARKMFNDTKQDRYFAGGKLL
jgi:hypothetical protein